MKKHIYIFLFLPLFVYSQNLEVEGDSYLDGKLGIGINIPESILHLYSGGLNGAGVRLIFGDDLELARTNAYIAEWGW